MTRGFHAARASLWLGLLALGPVPAAAQPAGTVTWGVHVTLAARWLDPAETESEITPFMILYALHDALVKPMPGNFHGPCLAESWTMSKAGRTWDFVLRKGVKFPGHTPGHQSLLVRLPRTGALVLSGDAVHFRDNWEHRRVPSMNANREQTLASLERIARVLQEQSAQLWINHDKPQSDGLRYAPAYYE